MRRVLISAFALALAACGQSSETQIAETQTFEDGGCLGVLLAHRAAVNEGRAEGDSAALTSAIEAWRTAGRAVLSADELAQYEASSFSGEHADVEAVGERAEVCLARTPPG